MMGGWAMWGDGQVRQRYFLHVLCAVMIFATQLVAVMHSSGHELAAAQATHCDLCAVAHAAAIPPVVALVPVLPRFALTAAVPAPANLPDRRPYARPNSRAPPALLA
ncbi:MAG: DUF2946 family protein [Solimonas sp.]